MIEVHRDLNTAFLEPDINLLAWIMSLQKLKKKNAGATGYGNQQIKLPYTDSLYGK